MGKKRLDARSYVRLLLTPQAKKTPPESVITEKLKTTVQEDNVGVEVEDARTTDRVDEHSLQVSPVVSPEEAERAEDGSSPREGSTTSDTSKRKRKSIELDSDDSTSAPNELMNSSADPVASISPESRRGDLVEQCNACSKRQRSGFVSENMCSCKYSGNHDLCNGSSSVEGGGEVMPEPCVGISDQMPLKESPSATYDSNACVICKLGGNLLCCDGKSCNKNYHLSCLDPPLKAFPPGVWHCFQCIKKKIQCGVHSVSEGVESICDVREEEVSDSVGIQKQKQYLVKYKGLAHVYNRWIPEHQLLLEVPSLVAKLKKNQVFKWKPEWTKPQRLIQKRALMSPTERDDIFNDCQHEWCVKWCGLGYEHATLELENSPFLRSPEAIPLIRDFESRLEKAIWAANPSNEKLLEERKLSSIKPSKLQNRNVSGLDNDYFAFVNKLWEYWRKNQNAVVLEDQERIQKVVSFITSMQSDVCRPFLIISSPGSLSTWENELMHTAPSVNFVTYSGNRDVRESIRTLEFYDDGGRIMLQVLLSPIDAVIEDVEALELIGWEAIIVDECQLPKISMHFEKIKRLTNTFRLLLFSGPVKENIAEYLNLLSFVESAADNNGDVSVKADLNDTITKLKEKFTRFVACGRKSDSAKFVEYWVPVQLSNLQIEQYCATLLLNSTALRSVSKMDPVGALRDILIALKKCCDHPFLVDSSVQNLLIKDIPEVNHLDVGVKASGKLEVLDKILLEVKRRGLRVIILFQSMVGSTRNLIGDYLDDFLRQRFGPDSYERVDSLLVNSKKQVALSMFNNKERGRFVFLLESRACSPSIKLSSVDMAILFNSDWNPLNDLRALQKISIDSQFEQLNVFRLYSPCTVEEKILCLAKQDVALDSKIQNISCGTSHALLVWGAHYQFHKLDEFHNSGSPSFGSVVEQSVLDDLTLELLNQLPNDSEGNKLKSCKFLFKVQHSGASYFTDITLDGEKEMQSKSDELPNVLWTNLLDKRSPRWRYASVSSQRIRKKVQYLDEEPRKTQENDEATKKRKKAGSFNVDSSKPKSPLDNRRDVVTITAEGASNTPSLNASKVTPSSTDLRNSSSPSESDRLRDSRKSLFLSLKPAISKLCEILQFQDHVKNKAGKLLEYIINNFNLPQEPVEVYQAFQISLCCSAASLLDCNISRKDALSLVKKHLAFQCKEEHLNSVDFVLRDLLKKFSNQTKSGETVLAGNSSPKDREKSSLQLRASQSALPTETQRGQSILAEKSSPKDTEKPSLHFKASQLSAHQELEEGEIRESPKRLKFSIHVGSSQQEVADSGNGTNGSSKSDSSKSIKQVKRIHNDRMKTIYHKQMEELTKFKIYRDMLVQKEIEKMEKKHQLESALIRSLHSLPLKRSEKQKKVDQEYERKKEDLNIRMEKETEKLKAMQQQARNKEKKMETHWIQEVKFGRSASAYAMLPLTDSGFSLDYMEKHGQIAVSHELTCPDFGVEHKVDCEENDHEKSTTSSSSSLENQDAEVDISVMPEEVVVVENCDTDGGNKVDLVSMETAYLTAPRDDTVNTSLSEHLADARSMPKSKLCSSGGGSPSLGKSLLNSPLDQVQDFPDHIEDDQVPSLQVPVRDCTRPSLPTIVQESIEHSCEVQHISHDKSQTPLPADSHALNEFNDGTLVLSPIEPLRRSVSTDPLSTEQCQPACTLVEQEESNEPGPRLESPTRSPQVDSQYETVDHSCLLPDNQISAEASQRLDVPAPLEDLSSTEQNQIGAFASTSMDQSVLLPDNQLSHAGSEQSKDPIASTRSPPSVQCQPRDPTSTCVNHSVSLPVNRFPSAASQQAQVVAPLVDPLFSTEEGAGTCIDRGQRNEPLQPLEAQVLSPLQPLETQVPSHLGIQVPPPLEGRNELFDQCDPLVHNQASHTATQLPAHLQVMEQNDVRSSFISRIGDQSLLNLSDSRSVRSLPDMTYAPPPIPPASSRLPPHLCIDPLQNELGRIRREEEHTMKKHEEEKLRLHSECEKEIEAIRKKYNAMLQQEEREFMERKKALETNHNMVYMNQILAVAFRLKCDSKTTGAPGVQQGSTQQQISHSPSPPVTERSSSMPGPSTAPPVQMVRLPSALFSSNPVRSQLSQPPHMPSKSHHIGTELRSPAPHLQPFRPVTSASMPSFSTPTVQPGQQPTSPSPIRSQPTPSQPTHMSGSFNSSGVRNVHTPPLSALQLLMDMDIHSNSSPRPPNLFSPIQGIGQYSETRSTPEQRPTTGNLRGSGNIGDVVCLSDDD